MNKKNVKSLEAFVEAAVAMLIDISGRLLAFNCRAPEWEKQVRHATREPWGICGLFAGSEVKLAIEGVLAGGSDQLLAAKRGDGEGPGGQVPVQIRRFEGPAGVLALVEILASSTTDADSPAGYVDVVTGLPDRRALAERDDAWRRTHGAAARFAVLFLDLDDFKRVNDLHGHPTGDLVLREAAGRWRGCLRDGDVVARYGGDEFVALIEGLVDRAGVEALVRRLEDVTRRPIDLGELQLHVHVTVGAALSPADGATLEELIAAADRDMYARKQRRLAPHSP